MDVTVQLVKPGYLVVSPPVRQLTYFKYSSSLLIALDTRHQLQVSTDKVEVRVQLVKPDYLVVSLPVRKPANPPTLGFVSTKDYNLLGSAAGDAARRFSVGQTLQASVAQLPTEETGITPQYVYQNHL